MWSRSPTRRTAVLSKVSAAGPLESLLHVVPLETLLPPVVQVLKPDIGKAPHGAELLRQAQENTALSYEERGALLLEGERLLAEDAAARRNWRVGQGLLAGSLAAGALVQGARALGALGSGLDNARHAGKVALLEDAAAAGLMKDPKLLRRLTEDVADFTGMRLPDALGVRSLLQGPLTARTGSALAATPDLAALLQHRLAKAGVNEYNNPQVSAAMRAILSPERSLWDQLSRKAATGLRQVGDFGMRPGVRALLGLGAVGTGIALGLREAGKAPTVTAQTPEEAQMNLRVLDQHRAHLRGSDPLPPSLDRLARAPRSLQGWTAKVDPYQADLLLGGAFRSLDAEAHMRDPATGARWIGI